MDEKLKEDFEGKAKKEHRSIAGQLRELMQEFVNRSEPTD